MYVSTGTLLQFLPPFKNNHEVIVKDQVVHDIINEVVDSHKFFASDYDCIYQFFDTGSIRDICKKLFDFCKANIVYKIETEALQTTQSPAAFLAIGEGDCKHYAGFIAGVLSAIVRNTGRKINWRYMFASYSYTNSDVEHVFVAVRDGNDEIWIDPVLNSFNSRSPSPVFIVDKKVNNNSMLTRVSGIHQNNNVGLVQTMDNVYLPVDYGSELAQSNAITQTVVIPTDLNDIDSNITDTMTDDIKQLLYYGVIDQNANIFDHVYQNLLATLSPTDAADLQAAYGRFFKELQAVGSLFGNIWNSVKQVGLAPARGAYLALVSLNVFGLASKMYAIAYNPDGSTYQPGVDRLQAVWHKKLMGDTNLLLRAIRNGHSKNKIFGIGASGTEQAAEGFGLSAAASSIPGVQVWVAAALVVIKTLAPIIESALREKQAAGYDMSAALSIPQPTTTNSFQKYLPYIVIAGVAYYLMSKQK